MATRSIHKKQPLAKRSKTLREAGSVSSFQKLPNWEKYMKFGTIAEELGKEKAAAAWRRKGFRCALDHGEYVAAETWATLYLSENEARVANSLALLRENLSTGRKNSDVEFLLANAMGARAPLELIKFELSRPSHPDSVFHSWKTNARVQKQFRKSA